MTVFKFPDHYCGRIKPLKKMLVVTTDESNMKHRLCRIKDLAFICRIEFYAAVMVEGNVYYNVFVAEIPAGMIHMLEN